MKPAVVALAAVLAVAAATAVQVRGVCPLERLGPAAACPPQRAATAVAAARLVT